ncbi:hypothetical protein DFH28DRAFT_967809 [Melampsora americana]|nr:hypothetical protein DFH28DRAFT_967809 [Melampsora americana]
MPSGAPPKGSTRKRRCSLDDQIHTSNRQQLQRERCTKIRRLSINAPPTLLPFISFDKSVNSVNIDQSFQESDFMNKMPLANSTMTSSHTGGDHIRSEIFTNINICHPAYWKAKPSLLMDHKRARSFEQENIPTHYSPHSNTRSINSHHFLNLDNPHYRLSHLNLFQHVQKKRKPALLDLSQTLGKLCIVDEVDESPSAIGL